MHTIKTKCTRQCRTVCYIDGGTSANTSAHQGVSAQGIREKIPKLSQQNGQYENCSHFWDIRGFCLEGFVNNSKTNLNHVPI